MERGDMRRDGRGSLHYMSSFAGNDSKKKNHSSLRKSVHKKHPRQHHQRHSSASDADAKRASYEENPHNWSECDSSQGRKYWFNIRTEKSQWEVPKAILLKRSREREANNRTSRDRNSPVISERKRGYHNSHSLDYFTSPLKREDEVDSTSSLPFLPSNSNSSHTTESDQNLITSLHPLQQALLVKNQLEHSTQPTPSTIPFKQSSLTSSPLTIGSNDSCFSLHKPTNSIESADLPSLSSLGRHELRPNNSVKQPTLAAHRGDTGNQINNNSTSHLEKFANTPGIRIKKKPIASTSSEGSFKFTTDTNITPIDIVVPESTIELTHDPDLMTPSLIYPFTSPALDYTDKELSQCTSERLNLCYSEHIDSLVRLTESRLNWEINDFSSQLYSIRATSLVSLIESNQLPNS